MKRIARCAALAVGAALGCADAGPDAAVPPLADDAGVDAAVLPAIDGDEAGDDLDLAGDDAAVADSAPAADGPVDSWSSPFDAEAGSPDLVGSTGNPFGITFTEVTRAAFGSPIQGGRSPGAEAVGTGAAIGDLDGDGWNDVVLARNDDPKSDKPGGPSLFFRNAGPGPGAPRFVADPGFTPLVAGRRLHAVALGDYDRDGDLDVALGGQGFELLLQNDGKGHFTDVTATAGIAGRADDLTSGVIFADLNQDGLLDLYVVNYSLTPGMPSDAARKRLHLNLGDGSFLDVSAASGTDHTGASHAAAVFDLDGSGHANIYLTNDRFSIDGLPGNPSFQPDAWYQLQRIDDQGVPVFMDSAVALGVVAWRSGMGAAFADVDGDLTPDIYLPANGTKWLYRNPTPGAAVIEAAAHYGLGLRADSQNYVLTSWGMRFMDLDRDGFLEVLVNHGLIMDFPGCEAFHQAPFFLRSPGLAQPYQDVTALVGIHYDVPNCPGAGGDPDRTTNRGVVVGDLDGDGDEDVILTSFAGTSQVYRNDTPAMKHALRVRLVGTVAAPDPIGATLIVTRNDGRRQAAFRYAGGDVYSFSDGVLTIGAGDDGSVKSAQVQWPSGWTQEISGLPGFALDRLVKVVEPTWLTVEPRVVKPGDPPARLTYRPVDGAGSFLNAPGAGRKVAVARSDGQAVMVTDHGDGSYTADLAHPGAARRTTLAITVDGKALRIQPMLNFK